MSETIDIFTPKIIDKITNILSLTLQRVVPQVTKVNVTLMENRRKEKYFSVETNTFQSNPIIFKTIYIDGYATPYYEKEEMNVVKLDFDFNFRCLTFKRGFNGVELGHIEIDIINGQVRVPDGFIYAMNF